jgi:anti-sigma B factor antagonist
VLDLAHVTFCDSSGLSTLLRLLRHARTADTGMALASVPAQMRRLLAVTGADTVFALYDSPAAALAAHHETARP